MKTSSTSILRFCLVTVCAAALGACGVSGPDETAWQDVRAFSWPTALGSRMLYKVERFNQDTTLHSISTETSDDTFHGTGMLTLNDSSVSYALRVRFLPLHDTLVTRSESFGATYALVAPLDKGRTWISAYSDAAETQPSWRATIIERFSQLRLEGNLYKNILVVRYEPVTQPVKSVWIRYYAEGIGPVQTIKKLLQPQSTDPNDLYSVQRTVLVESGN